MSGRGYVILVAVIVSVGTAAFAWTATRAELASGSGKEGDWRVVASWNFGNYCLKRYTSQLEGGACGFAQPGRLDESLSWRLFEGDNERMIVAGPAPEGTAAIKVTPEDDAAVEASLRRVAGMTFYLAELPAVQMVETVEAFDGDGDLIDETRQLPPPPAGF